MTSGIDARVDPAFWSAVNTSPQQEEWHHEATGIHRNGIAVPEHVSAQMRCADLERLVVHASVVPRERAIVSNDEIAGIVRSDPARLVGVAAVDPTAPDAPQEAERALDDLALRAAVVNLSRAHVHVGNPTVTAVLDVCQARGVPVVIPSGTSWEPGTIARYSRPSDLEEVIATRPRLTFWLTQWGWPWLVEVAMLMQKYPNVVTDTGMLYFDSAREFYTHSFTQQVPLTWIDRALRHQVMFASANPRFEQIRMAEALRHLPFRDSTLELLLHDNACAVLGLEH